MHFAQPIWLIIGAAAAGLLFYLYHRSDSERHRLLASFSLPRSTDDPALGISRSRLWLKRAFFGGAVLCLCVALARPLGGMHMQQAERRGIDILFALDTSRSMLTPDVKPNRLTRAKMAVEDLLDKLDGDGSTVMVLG